MSCNYCLQYIDRRYRSHFFNCTPATIPRVSYFSLNAIQIPKMVVEMTVYPTPMSTGANLDVDSFVGGGGGVFIYPRLRAGPIRRAHSLLLFIRLHLYFS